jgi:hypothetical protein
MGSPQEYDAWRMDIDDWTQRFLDAEPQLHGDVLSASLLERDRLQYGRERALEHDIAPEESRHRLDLHYRLIDELS